MEAWRRTASAASVENLVHINITVQACEAIDVAHGLLAQAAEAYGRFRLGLPNLPLDGEELDNLLTARDRIWSAIASTLRLQASHAGSSKIFSIAAASIGLQAFAPRWWQRWEGHHADAAAHADMALQRLRSAWAHDGAAHDAVKVMHLSSPDIRHKWGPAAEQLLRLAADELSMARDALEQMRPAVVAEFCDAVILLSR